MLMTVRTGPVGGTRLLQDRIHVRWCVFGRYCPGLPVIKTYLLYIPLALMCGASFLFGLKEDNPRFHGDESFWLGNARALDLVLDGRFDAPYWKHHDGWTQPHAAHYAYAIVLKAAGITRDQLPRHYNFDRTREWNLQWGSVPSNEVLLVGRRFSAWCGVLACLLLCEIGRRTFGWTVGLTAACWLALNPLMRSACQRAMGDGQVTLAIIAGVVLLFPLFDAWRRSSAWTLLLMSAGVGLLFGFAASLKINGGILCLIVVAMLPFFAMDVYLRATGARRAARNRGVKTSETVRAPKHKGKRRATRSRKAPQPVGATPRGHWRAGRRFLLATASVALVATLALSVFYALNPHIWPHGLYRGARHMIAYRGKEIAVQRERNPNRALTSVSERSSVAARALFVSWPTLRGSPFEDFKNPIDAAKRHRGLWYIEAPLFLFGAALLVGKVIRRMRRERVVDPACIVLIWLVLYSLFVFLWIPLAAARYYQKYLPLQALLFAIGAVWVIQSIGRSVITSRVNPTSARSQETA